MRVKLQIIFLFFLTLVLIPGFIWVLFTGKIAQAVTPTTSDSIIYNENLSSQWQNWSWNTTINFNATEQPHSGSKTIEATMNGWGGVYLHTDTAVTATTAESFVFSLKPQQDSSQFVVILYDETNQPIGTPQSLTTYGEAPAVNTWKTYALPVPSDKQIKGIALQDVTGTNGTVIFIDTVFVKNKISATPTPQPQPSTPPTTSSGIAFYSDGLANGWENWSWSSNINFDNSSPVSSGIKSLAFTPQSGWAGLYLHTNNLINTSSYNSLQFSLYASQADQKFAVALIDEQNQMIGSPLNVDTYGAPIQGSWKTYTISLADLQAVNKQISGIIVQEVKGQAQPTVYLDEITLLGETNDSGTVQPTAVPTMAPTAAPTVKPVKMFTTLQPGSELPSGEECAALVRQSPWEPRPENYDANHRVGSALTTRIDGADAEGNAKFLGRINGNFTGTTDEIIQWGSCKWGFDEEIVRAVAAQESWWRQSTHGDFNGSDYESYGLLQVRRTYHEGTYPRSLESTPFNVDYALAWRRACYEGHFNWIPADAKGDEWGCIGLWFSGRWYDGDPNVSHSGSNWYIGKVKGFLTEKPWLREGF